MRFAPNRFPRPWLAAGLVLLAGGLSGCGGGSFCQTAEGTGASSPASLAALYTFVTTTTGTSLVVAPVASAAITGATLKAGTLPPGLTLNPDGTITGTPTAVNVYPVTITLTSLTGSTQCTEVITVNSVAVAPVEASYPAAAGPAGGSIRVPLTVISGTLGTAALVTGSLPPGMTLDPATGTISGIPTTPGVYTFVVAVGAAGGIDTIPVVITVGEAGSTPLVFSYANASGDAGSPLTVTPTLVSGGPAVGSTLVSGLLPPGLTLDPNGTITGTPTAPGTYVLAIELCNAGSGCATQTVTITVGVAGTTSPATSYTDQVVAVGGTLTVSPASPASAITSAQLVNGSLPPGLTLSASGTITGTATTPGLYSMSIQVCDASDGCQTLPLDITVTPRALTLAYPTPQGFALDVAIATQSPALGGGLGSATSYAVTAGSLPSGLTLHADGTITGTPTDLGSFTFTVTATQATQSAAADVVYTVTSSVAPPAVSALAVTETYGAANTLTPTNTGGAITSASMVSGSLPSGLTLNPDGSISQSGATPVGSYGPYTVSYGNAGGSTSASVTITINASAPTSPWTVDIANTGTVTTYAPDSSYALNGQISITVPNLGQVAECSSAVDLQVSTSTTLPSGATVPAGANVYSPVFNITATNCSYPFRVPVTVTLAFNPATAGSTQLATTDVPMPFYWDPHLGPGGAWVAAGLQSISFSPSSGTPTSGSVTFTTLLTGQYIVMAIPGLAPASDALAFTPGTDDWLQYNPGNYDLAGGASLGMSGFASWYLDFEKATETSGLASVWSSATNANAEGLISRLGSGTLDSWTQLTAQLFNADLAAPTPYSLTPLQTGLALITGLQLTQQPQIFAMADSAGVNSAVATAVYGYNQATGAFRVMDPNYPGAVLTIDWNPSTGAFSAYSRAQAYSPVLAEFTFVGPTSIHEPADYLTVFQGALNGFDAPASTYATFSDLLITGTSYLQSVTPGSTYTIPAAAFPVTISGAVTNGDATATYVLFSQNGNAPRSAVALSPISASQSTFSFAIQAPDGSAPALDNPYGTTFTLETSANPCDPSFSHTGFAQFGVNEAGYADWLPDTCFEGPSTGSWLLQHADTANLFYYFNGYSIGTTEYTSGSDSYYIGSVTPVDGTGTDDFVLNGSYYDVGLAASEQIGSSLASGSSTAGSGSHSSHYTWITDTTPIATVATPRNSNTSTSYNSDGTWTALMDSTGYDPNFPNPTGSPAASTTNPATPGTGPGIQPVLAGGYSLMVNDGTVKNHVSRAIQVITVPAAQYVKNPALSFYWAAAMQSGGHPVNELPYIDILVLDVTPSVIAASSYQGTAKLAGNPGILYYRHHFAPSLAISGYTSPYNQWDDGYSGWITGNDVKSGDTAPYDYTYFGIGWQEVSVDLSGLAGDSIQVSITAACCEPGGHAGYVYLDNLNCQ
jgi:hypothetical protein